MFPGVSGSEPATSSKDVPRRTIREDKSWREGFISEATDEKPKDLAIQEEEPESKGASALAEDSKFLGSPNLYSRKHSPTPRNPTKLNR